MNINSLGIQCLFYRMLLHNIFVHHPVLSNLPHVPCHFQDCDANKSRPHSRDPMHHPPQNPVHYNGCCWLWWWVVETPWTMYSIPKHKWFHRCLRLTWLVIWVQASRIPIVGLASRQSWAFRLLLLLLLMLVVVVIPQMVEWFPKRLALVLDREWYSDTNSLAACIRLFLHLAWWSTRFLEPQTQASKSKSSIRVD